MRRGQNKCFETKENTVMKFPMFIDQALMALKMQVQHLDDRQEDFLKMYIPNMFLKILIIKANKLGVLIRAGSLKINKWGRVIRQLKVNNYKAT